MKSNLPQQHFLPKSLTGHHAVNQATDLEHRWCPPSERWPRKVTVTAVQPEATHSGLGLYFPAELLPGKLTSLS